MQSRGVTERERGAGGAAPGWREGGKSYACAYLSHDRVQTNTPRWYIHLVGAHGYDSDCPAPGRLSHPGMRNLLTGPLPAYIYAGAPSPSMLKHLPRRRSHQPPAGTASSSSCRSASAAASLRGCGEGWASRL